MMIIMTLVTSLPTPAGRNVANPFLRNSLFGFLALELVCYKKRQSPNQETGLGNREPLEALDDTKLMLNE
jgi:hypothetical protein